MVKAFFVRLVVAAALAAASWTWADDALIVKRTAAQAALLVGDYARAVTLADEILAAWPDDGGTYLIRGLAHMGRGEMTAAEPDLIRARKDFPDDASVSYNLALTAEHRGDHKQALLYLDEAIAHGLVKNDAYFLKAQILDRLGRRAEAREMLELYIQKRPATRDILLTLAQWARADGEYEKALAYYKDVLKVERTATTLAEVAATYEAAGNRAAAVTYYLEAASKGAPTSDTLAEFAADYAAAGDFNAALDIYGQLVKKFPSNAYYWFGYSFVRQQLGDAAAAEAGYRKVITLKNDFAEAYYNLGALADAAERPDEARSYYKSFLTYAAGRDDLAVTRARAEERLAVLGGL